DPRTLIATLKCADLVITNKLHVGIVSVSLNGRVISIPTHHKTVRFYDQLGLGDCCIATSNLSAQTLARSFDLLNSVSPDWGVVDRGLGELRQSLNRFLAVPADS